MAEPFKNTPPAPEDRGEMTAANVAAALAGESQAAQKYLAFADVAAEEGYPNAARLFRAVAYAESTHARNHLSVLGMIGSTAENLKAAWSGETFEIDEMYAAYTAVAKLQGNKSAQTTFRYAEAAERDHQFLYDKMHAKAQEGEDFTDESLWVCPVCGHTVIGRAPVYCVQCGTTKEYFKEF